MPPAHDLAEECERLRARLAQVEPVVMAARAFQATLRSSNPLVWGRAVEALHDALAQITTETTPNGT